ncbi:major facilitator transporter, partial [mine drainage metagenome]
LMLLPIDFNYGQFAAILLLCGVSMGAFAAPNRAAVMNSLPARDRGVGGGMNATFQNSAQVLSIGVFFSLMIAGLATTLSGTLIQGLMRHGVSAAVARHIGSLPPVSVLFAAFLGYNPIRTLLGPGVLAHLSAANRAALTGRAFFPELIATPFREGLTAAFSFATAMCLIAAAASWSRGSRYVHEDDLDRGPTSKPNPQRPRPEAPPGRAALVSLDTDAHDSGRPHREETQHDRSNRNA